MDAENSLGSYGIGTMPLIYDKFVENLTGKKLTDTLIFSKIHQISSGKSLSVDSFILTDLLHVSTLSGNRARLYAPSTLGSGFKRIPS